MQRSRDRRRGQSENIYLRSEVLEVLLMGDSEALLFIDDEEAELREIDILREQAMGADEDVDPPLARVFDGLPRVGGLGIS